MLFSVILLCCNVWLLCMEFVYNIYSWEMMEEGIGIYSRELFDFIDVNDFRN